MPWLLLISCVAVTPEARDGLGDDRTALALASQMESAYAWSIGVTDVREMDGGWRGPIRVEPQWPVGAHRRHLDHLAAAAADYDRIFERVRARAISRVRFRWRDLDIKLFRSNASASETPSAYAAGRQVGYNVVGALLRNERGVRETIFHELFHVNDIAHGHSWSESNLGPIYERIMSRCDGDTRCLAPYAPSGTRVGGGVFYAFHPEEGVEEYAAELALRWFREHREVIVEGRAVHSPFKCQTNENYAAWRAMVEHFFGGVDLTGDCSAIDS